MFKYRLFQKIPLTPYLKNIYNVQHSNIGIINNISNNLQTLLKTRKLAWTNYAYTLKPKTMIQKNAYIDEGLRVFTKKHHIIPQCLFTFENVHNDPLPIVKYEHSLWNKLRRYYYTYTYKNPWYIRYKMHQPALMKHYKEFNYQTFHNKNTLHQYHKDAIYYTFLHNRWLIFGHFICDLYPTFVHFWTSLSEKNKKKVKIIIPANDPNTTRHTSLTVIKKLLKASGVQDHQFFALKQGYLMQFQYLYLSYQTKLNPLLIEKGVQYLQNKCYNSMLKKKYYQYKRVFLDRKPQSVNRQIINKDEFNKILKKYCIKKIYIEDFTIQERINLLSNTKFLISTLSSTGLNAFFTKKNTKILIFTTSQKTPRDPFVNYLLHINHPNIEYQYHENTASHYYTIEIKKFENTIIKLLS